MTLAEHTLLNIINSLLLGKYIVVHCADAQWKHLRKEKGFPRDMFTFNKAGRIVGVEMDDYFIDALRGERKSKSNVTLPHDHTKKWDPLKTDMMYMAISCEISNPTIEAIIVIRKGIRETLLSDNISSIAIGHKEKRKREITYETVLSRTDIEESLYISLICGARSKYSRLAELLFFLVCALETSFTHVTLWIIHSCKHFPLRPLINFYTSRFGMIYPNTTPSPSRPFYQVIDTSGSPLIKPFVMFQRRKNIVLHGLQTLSQISELPIRIVEKTPPVSDTFNVTEKNGEEAVDEEHLSESDISTDDYGDEDEDFQEASSSVDELENVNITKRTTRSSSKLCSPIQTSSAIAQQTKSPKQLSQPDSPQQNVKSPKYKPKAHNTPLTQSQRITRSMTNSTSHVVDSLTIPLNKLNINK
jgi:hypothetical protein